MGLTNYWPMDEGSGTNIADSVGGIDGTLNDSSIWATDPSEGTYLSFTGSEKIDLPGTITVVGSTELTIETRVRISKNQSVYGRFFDLRGTSDFWVRGFFYNSSGSEGIVINGFNRNCADLSISLNQWYTWLIKVKLDDQVEWFVDGVSAGSTSLSGITSFDSSSGVSYLVSNAGPMAIDVAYMKLYDTITLGYDIEGNVTGEVENGVTINLTGDEADSTVTAEHEFFSDDFSGDLSKWNTVNTPTIIGGYCLLNTDGERIYASVSSVTQSPEITCKMYLGDPGVGMNTNQFWLDASNGNTIVNVVMDYITMQFVYIDSTPIETPLPIPTPISYDTWYDVKITNIDFTAEEYDIYIDDVFKGTCEFRESGSNVDEINFSKNYGEGECRVDDVVLKCDGYYVFELLQDGNYTITPSEAGYEFTPDHRDVTISGGDETGIDFVSALPTYDISGEINGHIEDGVTLNLTGDDTDSTVSSGGGLYSFEDLSNGNYTVTPVLAGYKFLPTHRDIVVTGADVPNMNFDSIALNRIISDQTGNNKEAYASEMTSNLLIDPGKIDKAHHYLDTSSQNAELPTYGMFHSYWSMAFWVRFHTINQYDRVIHFLGERDLQVVFWDSASKMSVRASQGSVTANRLDYVVSTGSWIHVMITWSNDDGWELYINNTLEDSDSTTDVIDVSSATSYIACLTPGNNQCDMDIDDFRLFTNILSEDNRDYIYNSGSGREDPV